MTAPNKQKRKLVEEAALETSKTSKKREAKTSNNDEPENPIDTIADISEAILEAPESAFSAAASEEDDEGRSKKSAPRMRQLLNFASRKDDTSVSQLALLSLLAVFKDILPSYRIRLPSTKEMAVKVSKDTKKLYVIHDFVVPPEKMLTN
jgi:nucleolar complex protein 3